MPTLFGDGTVTTGGTSLTGTIDLNGQSVNIYGLATAGTAASQIIGNGSTSADATLDYIGSGPSTYAGTIQDAIGSSTHKTAVTLNTTATLTLSGGNTFTGGLNVLSGTLAAGNNGNALGANSNIVTLGASGSSANATLTAASNTTYLQPIVTGPPAPSALFPSARRRTARRSTSAAALR